MSGRRAAIALIALVALVCHGALLLESVRVSDDWSYLAWIGRKEWATIHAVQLYANLPLMEYYFRAFGFFDDPALVARCASFLFVLTSAILTYLICLESGFVAETEARFIALISMVYPGYMMHTSLTLTVFTFCFLLFLAAALLALRSERAAGSSHAAMRVFALFLFLLSFNANSLLVYFGALLVVHFLVLRRTWALPWLDAAMKYALGRADYLAIPLLFWMTKGAVKSMYETNSEYNAISFNAAKLAGFQDFAHSIGAQCLMIVKSPWFSAVFLIAVATSYWMLRRSRNDFRVAASSIARSWALLAFGMLLLFCGTLPYVVVGKTPSGDLDQWGTRLCLLMGLPAGVIAVAIAGLLTQHVRLPRAVATGLLSAIVAGSGAVQAKHHFRFLANEIEARSLAVNLAQNPDAARFSVFGVVTPLPSFHITHQKYSWAYFLRDALGGELTRIAIMEDNIDAAASTRKRYTAMQLREETDDWWFRLYGMKLPPDGQQATLVIEPGPGRIGMADHRLVSRYLRAKWAGAEQLESFLRGVTAVKVIPKA
jgi:surface antigen